jgi:FHA domain
MGFKCPWGHQSANDEYCDFCGALNPAAPPMSLRPTSRPTSGLALVEQPCRVCGTNRDGVDRYCVNCGYDFEIGEPMSEDQDVWEALPAPGANGSPQQAAQAPAAGAPSTPAPAHALSAATALVLLVGVNTRRLKEADSPPPPADLSERIFMIDRSPILIGRDGPGLDIPIHGDPYVSRRHAEIVWMGAGWGVRDLGSTNGTRLNGATVEGSEVRHLAPEDVVEVGFFTQITVRDLLRGER